MITDFGCGSGRLGCQCPKCRPEQYEHDYNFLKGFSKMHYRNGREAKNGDKVVQLSSDLNGQITGVGILHGAIPGNDYCNGNIAPIQNSQASACLCDCLHVDDIAEFLKEKKLNLRPAGK